MVLSDLALCKAWQLILFIYRGLPPQVLSTCNRTVFQHVPQSLVFFLQEKIEAKLFYMLQVFKFISSLETKKKANTEEERESVNGVSKRDRVTT